jgi:DNA polymerase-3 subunit delta'
MMQPNDLDYKIYIIEGADLLTIQAQNALLLTLEEPPPYVLFLLLCTSATNLLETIRSRAPSLRLNPIEQSPMGAYLGRRDRAFAMLPGEEQQQILLLADGSVGRALELLNSAEREPLMQRRAVAASFVSAMLERRDAEKMTELMAGFGKSREDIMALLVDIETALRDLILLKRSDEVVLRFYTDPASATELGERVPMQTLLSLLDRAESTRRQLMRNANVRLALTALLF